MNLADITPLLICFNEELNLPRTLAALQWADRIVVVDSGSTDRTLALLAGDSRITVLYRRFDRHAEQWSFALAAVDTAWVLALDADHVLTPEFVEELRELEPCDVAGYIAPFSYCIDGRALSASLLPPRHVLFQPSLGRFINDGHTQRVLLTGACGQLAARIRHDDRKPLSRWLAAQVRYAVQEAEKLATSPTSSLNRADRLRRWGLAPFIIVPYCLLACGLWRDGRAGWFYTLQRLYFEVLLALLFFSRRNVAPSD